MEKRWRRLPGSRTEPAGLERKVLARLPMVALVGTAACMAVSLLARLHWWSDDSIEAVRALQMIDIWVLAAGSFSRITRCSSGDQVDPPPPTDWTEPWS